MKDIWKTMKLGMYIFALPLVATAAASGHQWMADSNPATLPDFKITATVNNGIVVNKLRSHTITLDREGVVTGRLVSINAKTHEAVGLGNLKIYFARDGEIVQQANTDSDGSFSVDQLAEGSYSFIAAGSSGFAAYGVNVVSGDGDAAPTLMEVAAVSPKFNAVREILRNRLPENVAKEIIELAKSNLNEPSPIELVGANRVRLVDGELSGNVVPLWGKNAKISRTFVYIVKNDKEIASVQVDLNGHFQIAGIEPGVYDFVAAGPTGFAAVGFEAVDEDIDIIADSEVIEVTIPTSIVDAQDYIAADAGYVDAGYADSLDVALTSPQDNYIVSDAVGGGYASAPIEYAGEAAGCGAAAGGACGSCGDVSGYGSVGGGGFGGTGMLGKLGILAAITLGAVAIGIGAGDDDPVSPSEPN